MIESTKTGFQNKSDNLFNKINKIENVEFYVNKSLKRFKACLLALTYLLEPLSEQVVVKVKINEILNFLKRVYFFDFKKLVIIFKKNFFKLNLNLNLIFFYSYKRQLIL